MVNPRCNREPRSDSAQHRFTMRAAQRLAMGMVWLGWISAGNTLAQADVIWIKSQTEQIYGQIVSISDSQIEILVFENGSFSKTISVDRLTIDQVVSNFSAERLSQLRPADPAAYRDYAEELAAQKKDPAARNLAMRLYLIAAANSNGALRSSSLAGLVSIAESENQRQRLEMLRSLVDPNFTHADRMSRPATLLDSVSDEQSQLMLNLVHAIRRENSDQAMKLLSSQANRDVFDLWNEHCDLAELDRMSRVNRISKFQLAKLLRIESRIVLPDPGATNSGRKLGWGDYATQTSGNLDSLPSFKNVTRFDPDHSVYRDGKWIEP